MGAQHPVVRRLWPRRYRRSDVFHRLIALNDRTGFMDRIDRGRADPSASGSSRTSRCRSSGSRSSSSGSTARSGCGRSGCARSSRPAPSPGRAWPSYPLRPRTTYVNVGFWGTVHVGPDAPDAPRQPRDRGQGPRARRPQVALLRGVLRPRDLRPPLRRRQPRRPQGHLRPGRPVPHPLRQGGAQAMTRMTRSAEALDSLLKEPLPVRFTAYDGSASGPEDSPYRLHLATERGLTYLLTAPATSGSAGPTSPATSSSHGVHPGDPYEAARSIQSNLGFRRPSAAEAVERAALARARPPQAGRAAAAGGAVADAPDRGRAPALAGPRRRGDPPPLRRLEPLLRAGARARR